MKDPIFDYRISGYDPSIVPNLFVAMMDVDATSPAEWIPRTGRSLGQPGWGLVYHIALSVLRPDDDNLVIETGTNLGSTAIMVGQAMKDSNRGGEVRTIEIDAEIAEEASRRIDIARVSEFIRVFVGSSLDVLPEIIGSDERIRMAFLDGNHFHDHVVAEFESIREKLHDDAVVIFDNTYAIGEGNEDPRVNGALRTIVDTYGGNLINFPICSWYTPGLALWQLRPFDDMAPPKPGTFVSET